MVTKTEELLKAIQCLYLEVDASIASDVKRKAVDVLDEKDAEIEWLKEENKSILAAVARGENLAFNLSFDGELSEKQKLIEGYQKQIEDLEQRLGTRYE